MSRMQLVLTLGLGALLLATWGFASYQRARAAEEMAAAAKSFLDSLSSEQRARTLLEFEDDERMNWHFIPDSMWPRKGITFKELDPAQRHLAYALLSTGLSQRGYVKATTIMSLEAILKELEKGTGPVRDPELYHFTIFNEPSPNRNWGWRVEGHHISLNFTLVHGKMVATVPTFLGSNPAEVKSGPRQGLRVLAREEDLARDLLLSLDETQRRTAILEGEVPKDIITGHDRKAQPGDPVGLPVSKMNPKQKDQLLALLKEYARNLPEELAAAQIEKLQQAGIDRIHFAWAGPLERGHPHYYRVQGPTFVVEYDNTQNNANHIHTVWRSLEGDWGLDLLKLHYDASHQK
ncbi:MAG: DUF3500 domain-containing protein [Acidobacteriota bacterium]